MFRKTRMIMAAAAGVILLFSPTMALASVHLWDVQEVYSNTDGTVQFVELFTSSSQPATAGATLSSTGATNHTVSGTYSSGTSHILFATGTIAGVVPDEIIPANFLTAGAGNTVTFAGVDSINLDSLPTDGVMSLDAIFNNGNTPTAFNVNPQATPTNFSGISATLPEPASVMLIATGLILWGTWFGRRR